MIEGASLDQIDQLNPQQKEVVCSPFSHHLVLAGAGSGKTRVLVSRIVWIVSQKQVSPYNVMAVTFTNKAANELRTRVESALGARLQEIWIGTFHSICHRILRFHAKEADLTSSFQIMDSDDQQRLIKKIHKEFNMDEDKWPSRKSQSFINHHKEHGKRVADVVVDQNPYNAQMLKVYERYESLCRTSGLVDFTELLLRVFELLRDNVELRAHYQQRFRHVLVDEFQDTNALQYAWLKLLTEDGSYLTAVGDDDQSIYSWRGAKVENIFIFEQDFPGALVSRLEQNYRSTGNILAAANEVIHFNSNRMGKKLWTQSHQGEKISLYRAFNEYDEAKFVAHQLSKWVEAGNRYEDAAILYRSNAQSRVVEEQLVRHQVPYRIYGGLRFFDRAEIKDAIAYMRLVVNPDDDAAFERVINTPTRGIGHQTLEVIRDHARTTGVSMWSALLEVINQQGLPSRALSAVASFVDLRSQLVERVSSVAIDLASEEIIRTSGLLSMLQAEKTDKNQAKIENLFELVNAAKQFKDSQEEATILDFLSQAALDTGESETQGVVHGVQLMTLHAAKGLEFPMVFLLGLEEGLFPHKMSASDPDRLEEERRLCYVGMTRAMKKLCLTYAEVRRMYGHETYQRASRFLEEIPKEYLEEVRLGRTNESTSRSFSQPAPTSKPHVPYGLGRRVRHPKFGEGVVLNCEGSLEEGRVQVKFHNAGVKWLLLQYANLELL
ncbi:MAG: DNA helicase II [Legionellales bacterium]|nr:DNA helicase II [Legionellales bacterium]OUX65725.1 MAG: DNA helicase II [Gammaproteobacteria bacterium TMED281]